MRKIVLDTDLIIDFLRTGVGRLEEIIDLAEKGEIEVYVSSVTVLELWSGKSSINQEKLISDILVYTRTVFLDDRLGRFIGELRRDNNITLLLADLIIGATAVWIKGGLVTRNKKHFEQIPGIKFWKG